MTDQGAAKGTIFIAVAALKQMIAWDLLCLGITKTKDQDFDIELRADGVIVRTGKR